MPHGFATLTVDEVADIHNVLTADFAASGDPISPPGIRSDDLLASAVSRQHVGLGEKLKYDTPVTNAASLCYGICSNHPFHNGNKRTALVALLCHLDRNGLTFDSATNHGELYELMLRIADHKLVEMKGRVEDRSDQEVEAISKWVRKRTRNVQRGERIITFRELKSILLAHKYRFENLRNNYVDVVRYVERPIWLGLKTKTERERVIHLPYPGDGQVVSKALLKEVRIRCQLTEDDGVDSQAFYSKQRPVDYFVNQYRGTLRRLARV